MTNMRYICNCFIWIKWCAPNPRDFKTYPSVPGTLVLEVDPCIAWQLEYCNSSYLVIQYRPTTATSQPLQILTTSNECLQTLQPFRKIRFTRALFCIAREDRTDRWKDIQNRPTQLAELPRREFDPELFPHSAYVQFLWHSRQKCHMRQNMTNFDIGNG